jgi:hypothetical protein
LSDVSWVAGATPRDRITTFRNFWQKVNPWLT